MAKPRCDKTEVRRAIGEHLIKTGGTSWGELRQAFPDVPVATFWRWVKEMKARPSPEQFRAARTLLAQVPGSGLSEGAVLPAPISLTTVAAGGLKAVQKIDFILEVNELMSDARLLRGFAMTPDMTGVRDSRVFIDAAKLRTQVLQMYVTALPLVYSGERTQHLYTAVIDAVASCDPGMARQILDRVRALSSEAGFLADELAGAQ
jgi:hypothetical protein